MMKLSKLPFIQLFVAYFLLVCISSMVLFFVTKDYSWQFNVLFMYNVLLLVTFVFLATQMIFSELSKQKKNTDNIFHQIEAFHFINQFITPKIPISNTRNWIASPDFISVIFKNVLLYNPKNIVELGSGVSTIYTSYLIEKHNIDCIITSIDHSDQFTEQTNKELTLHQLQNIAKVYCCALKSTQINSQSYNWYDISKVKIPEIDFLVVDGPITLQGNERFPALPMLYDKLVQNAIVLVDDYYRKGDTKMVEDWLKQFPNLKLVQILNTEKGTAVLQKMN